jgi:hypothetical protein
MLHGAVLTNNCPKAVDRNDCNAGNAWLRLCVPYPSTAYMRDERVETKKSVVGAILLSASNVVVYNEN